MLGTYDYLHGLYRERGRERERARNVWSSIGLPRDHLHGPKEGERERGRERDDCLESERDCFVGRRGLPVVSMAKDAAASSWPSPGNGRFCVLRGGNGTHTHQHTHTHTTHNAHTHPPTQREKEKGLGGGRCPKKARLALQLPATMNEVEVGKEENPTCGVHDKRCGRFQLTIPGEGLFLCAQWGDGTHTRTYTHTDRQREKEREREMFGHQ